jgi:hypothetical protein
VQPRRRSKRFFSLPVCDPACPLLGSG